MKKLQLIPFVLIVAALLALAGCAAPAPEPDTNADVQQTESTAAEPEPEPATFEVSLGFAGDLCLADNYIPMEHLAELNSTDISDGIDQRFIDKMREVDLMWINNEFVFSNRGEPIGDKMWTFCGATENVKYLHDLGIDIVGLANNHVFDFGEESFLDTLDTLKDAGIPYVGAGLTLDEASSPVYLEANGVKVAYVAASRAEYTIYTPEAGEYTPGIMWCYDNELFLEEIREAAANADYVVALPHWGVEHSTELEYEQVESAHAYIDAGADAVIGAHPHILQGLEYYEGKPIMYSLGNFWFDAYDIDTLVAEIRISGEKDESGRVDMDSAKVELVLWPGTQSEVFTAWSDASERTRIFDYLGEISDYQVSISDDGVVHPA
ncbi:MAG: CapA family protein [Coriobacteriia bacterium]|nr:CapA family protein [Coriobacteriia bacterium]